MPRRARARARAPNGHAASGTPRRAHARALKAMDKKALLDLSLRLGEGSGAAMGAVLVKTALHLHNNMATFTEAAVSDKAQ